MRIPLSVPMHVGNGLNVVQLIDLISRYTIVASDSEFERINIKHFIPGEREITIVDMKDRRYKVVVIEEVTD